MHQPKSISEHIECLARLTGAPIAFVDQVRALFIAKGISLDAVAAPFLDALDEAFRREERIRCSAYRAQQNVSDTHANFERVGRVYVDQLARKHRAGQKTEAARRWKKSASSPRTTQVTIHGDHRTFVTKPEREELPMVPGPEDLQ